MKKLYLECAAGISGDMFVAAMLDLGADEQKLREALDSLALEGYQIKISRVKKAGIDAMDFDVVLDASHDGHDHDMAYLHGEENEQGHHHHHDHDHEHEHHHDHEHHHHHEHRTLSDILTIINRASISEEARVLAKRIFGILGEAEAKAHGIPADQIHFHEVGAVDSIVDIIAAAVCFTDLEYDHVIIPRLCEGQGTVRCAHGVLPVPVPAVANIVEAEGLTLSVMPVQGEFVTPTGAAIAAAIRTEDTLPGSFSIEGMGIGAGKRAYERPSILRAMSIRCRSSEGILPRVLRLETDLDDIPGEGLGFVMERLYQAGALEVHFVPIYMKKNRPGTELVVICKEQDGDRLSKIIFSDTTTIGIRRLLMERTVLDRKELVIETPKGLLHYKEVFLPEGGRRVYPEYESVRELAARENLSYAEAFDLATQYRLIHESIKDVI